MNILITGGAGFIGSNITEFLLTNNKVNKVRILDNLSTNTIIIVECNKNHAYKLNNPEKIITTNVIIY